MSSVFPPVASWGLDPLYAAHRRLLIRTVRSEVQVVAKQLYIETYLCFRPISRVEILGVVVSKRTTQKKLLFGVDDSTGCIEVYQFFDDSATGVPLQHIQLGCAVLVRGVLELVQGHFVIAASQISAVTDVNAETHHQISAAYLYHTEYSLPFVRMTSPAPVLPSNPFLTCTCRGMLRPSSSPSPSRSGSGIEKLLTQGQVDRVRNELLYCRCHAKESPNDPLGVYRLMLARYLLDAQLSNDVITVSDTVGNDEVREFTLSFARFSRSKDLMDTYGKYDQQSNDGSRANFEESHVRSLVQSGLRMLAEDGVLVQHEGVISLVTVKHCIQPSVTAALAICPDQHDPRFEELVMGTIPACVPAWRVQETASLLLLQAYSSESGVG